MGDSKKVNVTDSWAVIDPTLTDGKSYAFQNITNESMFLHQATNGPVDTETGQKLLPGKSAKLVKEVSKPIRVRMKTGKGVAWYSELT